MSVKFGRLPAHPETTHPRLHLTPHLAALPAPPPSVDWYSVVRDWPVFLNDQIGDCTVAMEAHILEASSTYGRGSTVEVDDRTVLATYERISGYTPADPSTDQGAVLQDVYSDWRTNGLGLNKILAYAQVEFRNLVEVRQAVQHFGAVGLGIVVTDDMMDDFNAGLPWARATGNPLGGHAVPVVGYDADNVYVVTWGRVVRMAWGVLVHATEEAWVAVLPEWFDAAGTDPNGVDLFGLGEAFHVLTGEPNPFPGPGPVVTSDQVLAASARLWLPHRHTGTNRKFAQSVETWMAAKGL